ncbi:methionine--tRNA ligase [bacterium]|nr:methionine--tRNA ligase [bacterium]
MTKSKFYITTPIYYANSVPHIGNAYTTIVADVVARYKRAMGYDVMFLTGMDEHGQKVQSSAQSRGIAPQQYVDEIAKVWARLISEYDITSDEFIRTSEPRHKRGVLKLLERMMNKGDVYEGEYEGWYCRFEENFLTDLQVVDGKCPDCGRPVERSSEHAFFFAMSKYEKPLLEYFDAHPNFIRPNFRMNEARRFVEQGLKDLCISRPVEWGIHIPGSEDYTIYVWVDALINYLTGIGFGTDDEKFERFWPCDLHLLGKDILKFHCILWPAMLMSADVPLPKSLYNHGWLRISGEKMSKSVGNVVDPFYLVDNYGADAVRYFLLRDVKFGQDGNFSEENLIVRNNSDLANDLGNLVHRSLSMCIKYFDGEIPSPVASADDSLRLKSEETFAVYSRCMDDLDFRAAIEAVWELISKANTYIAFNKPWELKKNGQIEKLAAVLYNVIECGRIILHMLGPVIPSAAGKMLKQIGVPESPDEKLERLAKWGGLPSGTKIGDLVPAFEKKQLEVVLNEGKDERQQKGVKVESMPIITIDDFAKVQLVVGEVRSAEPVPGSKNLFKVSVDIGSELRTAVAGIKEHYSPEDLVGKKIVFVANLAPAKIYGVLSEGMILAAGTNAVSLITLDRDLPVGSKVR